MATPNDVEREEMKEAVATLLLGLPEPVRNFITGPDRDRISLELSRKYQLHADQAGEFDRAYIQMLLGAVSPEEFGQELRRAGIPDTAISGLTRDINEMVFKPLRQKEQEMTEKPVPTPPPARPAAPPSPRPVEPPPRPAPPPPPAPEAYPNTPLPQGAQQHTYWVPVSITAVPQPYISATPPPGAYHPQPQAPAMPPPPPPPAPPVMEERAAPPPPVEERWAPPPPPPVVREEASPTPLTKDYSADPYREPIQ